MIASYFNLIPDEVGAQLCRRHQPQLLVPCKQQALAGGPAGSCHHQLPPNAAFSGAGKAAQLKSISLRFLGLFFFQARCLPEAEVFFKKVLVEMFAWGMGRKKKNLNGKEKEKSVF